MKINYEEVTIVTRCPFCGKAQFIAVNEADYWDWQEGELAQNAFPYLSADDREALISGICRDCWEEMFGSDEEPDEDDHPIQKGMLGVYEDEEPQDAMEGALAQFATDVLTAIFGDGEPEGVLDDYALEFMEHMDDEDEDEED